MKYTALIFFVLQILWTGPAHGLSDHHEDAHEHIKAGDIMSEMEHDTDHAHVHLSLTLQSTQVHVYGPIAKSLLLDNPEKNLVSRIYSPPVPPPNFS